MNRLTRETLATILIMKRGIKTIKNALTEIEDALVEIEDRLDKLHDEVVSEIQKELAGER